MRVQPIDDLRAPGAGSLHQTREDWHPVRLVDRPRRRGWPAPAGAAALGILAGCASTGGAAAPAVAGPASSASSSAPAGTPPPSPSRESSSGPASRPAATPSKVMVIAEENHTYDEVLGQGRAPYLSGLARTYASFTAMNAGYPTVCPSLAAYLLMTSGDAHGVCDDAGPDAHPISGPSVFSQLPSAGLEWRLYAESMPAPCTRDDSADGRYLVRHAPAPYYVDAAGQCPSWDLPLGTPSAGALHDDVVAGSLPAYAFVTPDACDDMHGASGCPADPVAAGDQWLARWVPQVLAGPDYRAGRLVIVITWDEGSTSTNHIPTIVMAPSVRGAQVTTPTTQCGLLALEERVLHVLPLGCAQSATSPAAALGLVA
ncbi:MAG: alkaline phosphatase family protein [Kineosporiaceae bacterium]